MTLALLLHLAIARDKAMCARWRPHRREPSSPHDILLHHTLPWMALYVHEPLANRMKVTYRCWCDTWTPTTAKAAPQQSLNGLTPCSIVLVARSSRSSDALYPLFFGYPMVPLEFNWSGDVNLRRQPSPALSLSLSTLYARLFGFFADGWGGA